MRFRGFRLLLACSLLAPGCDSGGPSVGSPSATKSTATVTASADAPKAKVSRRMEQLELALKPVTSLGGRQFWSRLEAELDRQAAPAADMPPEKKRKLLAQIKIIADRWRPFLTEAAAATNGVAKEPGKP